MSDDRRPTPEEILARVMRDERKQGRGRLKIFLGFAAGVGKTYEMLNEAQRREHHRSQDVVVGYVETHGRRGTEEQLSDLQVVPRKKIEYRGAMFEEMDTDAILKRHPQWVLVDELAHTNVPGSEREKRWQDVEMLLDAGINVATTMNVQHLESLNDTVHDITGIWVRETVPDRIVRDADEVKMVDITPRSLIHRLERGDIYRPEKIDQALSNWFKEGNLSALREIALREIAHEVEAEVTQYQKERHVKEAWATHDRIMVCLSADPESMRLVRRGWRISQRLQGDIMAVYVESKQPTTEQQRNLRDTFAVADRLNVPVTTVHGDVAEELIRFAKEHRITQIVVGHSDRTRWQEMVHGSIINKLTQELRSADILLVANPQEETV